ncbi:hypothetical protein [Lentibacillus amyloliquefaciens]|uniref:ATP-binding protein n=1 Tax=Lentibacillus amyloliquefaciens TaxID=1472767 RepID=A0A0U4EDA3_9BACI|nr:hypothetical protein [Lentibacillus amyloliquefaciens]ALX48553.1 hypothetical protein AOX59_07980 [Lentibacillus amyloliquefaciens]
MNNVVILPLTAEKELVIASDNSGGIGEKRHDAVGTSNTVVGRFACRVAVMECLAAGGAVQAVVMQNFTSDEAWLDYKHGAEQVLDELDLAELPITGSTESNFPGLQSGLGLTVIGTRSIRKTSDFSGQEAFAVIGTPLVGQDVLEQPEKVAPLWLFQHLSRLETVKALLPIGSKGVAAAWRNWTQRTNQLDCVLDLEKSAGPATCFLIAFDKGNETKLREIAGSYFHRLIPVDDDES